MTADATREFLAAAGHRPAPRPPAHPDRPGVDREPSSDTSRASGRTSNITDPAVLDTELDRVRRRLQQDPAARGIGYVTPDDEHHGRGDTIRQARLEGLRRARQRASTTIAATATTPPRSTMTWFISQPSPRLSQKRLNTPSFSQMTCRRRHGSRRRSLTRQHKENGIAALIDLSRVKHWHGADRRFAGCAGPRGLRGATDGRQ